MIKKITTLILILGAAITYAQQGTSSPYSYFGIGESKFKGAPEQKSMGGVSIFPDSTHVNLLNPASYSGLKFTAITVGGSGTFTTMETSDNSEKSKRSSLEYLAVGIPIGKFGVAFGLNPNTVVGYRVLNKPTDNTTASQYEGEGGSNRVFLGGAYKVNDKLDIGLNANYYFGEITTISRMYTQDIQFGTRIDNILNINAFSLDLGVTYKGKIADKYDFHAAATFTPSYSIDIKKLTYVGTVSTVSGYERYDDIEELPIVTDKYKMPSTVGAGFGVGKFKKWFVAADMAISGKSDFSNPISGSYATYKNNSGYKLALGGFYIPNYNSFTSYFERVTYRGGVRYQDTGLEVNGEKITDIGASLGFNLPIGNGYSDLSFAFEYGKRGTVNAGLIQENYFNVTIGITIVDKWFRKYLFD
jgi:hypothetical protein